MLRGPGREAVACRACRTAYPIEQGLIMLGSGDATPPPDFPVTAADVRAAAGAHWPGSFGTTIRIGGGVPGLTEALTAEATLSTLTIIDTSAVSVWGATPEAGAAVPVRVAADNPGDCLRDVCADTIVGTLPHESPRDARFFLNHVYRALRPGGRALFIEPNPLFRRRFMDALGLVLERILLPDQEFSADAHRLIGWLAHQRRTLSARNERYLLAGFETPAAVFRQAVIDHARTLGFQRVDLLPVGGPDGIATTVALMCEDMRIGPLAAQDIEARLRVALAANSGPLADASHVMLSLTKPRGPHIRLFELPSWPAPEAGRASARWVLRLRPRHGADGLAIAVDGWCLADRDATALRVTAGGRTARASIWRPRPDVYRAINADGRYPAWNAMCCGVDEDLSFPGIRDTGEGVPVSIRIEFTSGMSTVIKCPERVEADVPVQLAG